MFEFRKENNKRTIEDEWDFRTPKESEEALNSPPFTKRLGKLVINRFSTQQIYFHRDFSV